MQEQKSVTLLLKSDYALTCNFVNLEIPIFYILIVGGKLNGIFLDEKKYILRHTNGLIELVKNIFSH